MSSQLQSTLVEYLNSGWQSNPALRTLVHDYTKYHTVLAIAGGIVLLVSAVLTVRLWMQFKRVPAIRTFKWPFEKKVYFTAGSVLTMFSLLFVLVWAANLSTSLKPLPGFTSLASSTTVPSDSATGKALIQWVQSGSSIFPPTLKEKAQDRIDWQRSKAIICGLLLVVVIVINARVWSSVIQKSKVSTLPWSLKDRTLMLVGGATFLGCLLLVIMVVANAQGAIAPIAISLFGTGG
jgi:hypothetical protein